MKPARVFTGTWKTGCKNGYRLATFGPTLIRKYGGRFSDGFLRVMLSASLEAFDIHWCINLAKRISSELTDDMVRVVPNHTVCIDENHFYAYGRIFTP
jgi:hypothetical protein